MSRDYRHGTYKSNNVEKQSRKQRREIPTVKVPSKRYREDTLRRAVHTQDHDAFEDYDEYDV